MLAVAAVGVACSDDGRSATDIVDDAWRSDDYREDVCETMQRAGDNADAMFRRIGDEQGIPEEAQERLLELARRDC